MKSDDRVLGEVFTANQFYVLQCAFKDLKDFGYEGSEFKGVPLEMTCTFNKAKKVLESKERYLIDRLNEVYALKVYLDEN